MNGAGAILLKSGGAAYVPPKNGEDALFGGAWLCR